MGIYDRDYMKDPEPRRNSFWSVLIVVLFLLILLSIAFLRRNPKTLHRLTNSISQLIHKK